MIYCIGDSHVSIFSGKGTREQPHMVPTWPETDEGILPEFKTIRLGDKTAYNSPRIIEHIKEVLATLPIKKDHDHVMLVFGEIDCRVHLLKIANQNKRLIKELVKECIDNYFLTIDAIRHAGYNVLVWGVPCSTKLTVEQCKARIPDWPVYGTPAQRHHCASLFNFYLKEKCMLNGIDCINIFFHLLDNDGSFTDDRYFMDDVHLCEKALPIIEDRFRKYLPQKPLL